MVAAGKRGAAVAAAPPRGGLLAAIRSGSAAAVQRLLDLGAAVNQVGPKGVSPLEVAAEAGHVLLVQLLLRHGASVDIAAFEKLSGCKCGGHVAPRRRGAAAAAAGDGGPRSTLRPRVFPAIDVAPFVRPDEFDDAARLRSARAWDESFRSQGFAVIEGHGVSQELIEDLRTAAKVFFTGTTEHKYRYYKGPKMTGRSGYSPIGAGKEERGGHSDPLEGYMFMRSESSGWNNLSESHPEELNGIGQRYCNEMERVMHALHRMSALALGLDQGYFDPFYTSPASVLVISHYPPLRPPLDVKEGKLRYRAHSDYSGFTILLQDEDDWGENGAAGLEIDVGGTWVPVKPQKGTLVVNIGDLFETWTNDRWRSTPHRVSSPPLRSRAAGRSRLTAMLFSGPNLEALIGPIHTCVDEHHPCRYETVRAADHLRGVYKSKSKEAKYKPG